MIPCWEIGELTLSTVTSDDLLYGGGGDDLLYGDPDYYFYGRDGNNYLYGQGGNDELGVVTAMTASLVAVVSTPFLETVATTTSQADGQ